MEQAKLDTQTDYWLVQYQRLMDRKPDALIDMVSSSGHSTHGSGHCVCVCVHLRACDCVHACVRVCVRACVLLDVHWV